MAAETELLIKFMAAAQFGDVLTYADMREACRVDVQKYNHHLQTARKVLLKQGMVFGTIIGTGVERLADESIPGESVSRQKRARRMAKRGLHILACADFNKMSPATKITAVATRTVLGFMANAGNRATFKLIETAANSSHGQVDLEKLDRLLNRKKEI